MVTALRRVAAASRLFRLAFALVLSVALLAGGALPANAQRSRDPRTPRPQ